MAATSNALNNPRRMQTAILIAIALHVLLISITFSMEKFPAAKQRFDITLNQSASNADVEDADFLAQFDQQANGNLDDEDLVTSPDDSELNAEQVHLQAKKQEAQQASQHARENLVLTQENAAFQIQSIEWQEAREPREKLDGLNEGAEQTTPEVASLEAKLAAIRQARSREERTHRLTSVAAKSSDDANYLYAWQKRIEQLGNQHYPEEARRRGIFGELQLLVIVRANGSVEDMKVLKSSGHRLLDSAAQRIVRTAAPFPVFPAAMKEKYDRLEIIRTWKFQKGRFSGQ